MRHPAAAIVIIATITTAACILVSSCSSHQASPRITAPTGRARTTAQWIAPGSVANGKSLYLTGKDLAGIRMSAEPAPRFHRCVDCHRVDGSGGKEFADGAVSADLRHAALVTQQRHPYTLALLERAISSGIDNEGKPLDRMMPHWRLSQRDLRDVAQYVLTQLK